MGRSGERHPLASRRRGLGARAIAPSSDLLTATFLNVGQGDATLVAHRGERWTALVDGGWDHAIERHLPWMRSAVPSIDLLVGTHCDGDHLAGLCRIVEDGASPPIGQALLPPFVHPTGDRVDAPGLGGIVPGRSALAADHVRRGGARAVVAGLEQPLAASALPARLERALGGWREIAPLLAAAPEVEPDRGDAGDAEESPPFATLHGGVVPEGELRPAAVDALAGWAGRQQLPATAATLHGLAAAARIAPVEGLHALAGSPADGEALATVRAAAEVAADVSSAVHLERLVEALQRRGIPWQVACAPPLAAPQGARVQAWHLAPTERYVEHLAPHLPVVKHALFDARSVDPGLPSYANRLSHVIGFRHRDEPLGLLLTGDAGFQRARGGAPESLSSDWERILRWARLIDVPHHGGTFGHFGRRLLDALDKRERDLSTPERKALDLYLSVGHPNRRAPPSRQLGPLLEELRSRVPFLTLHMAAAPRAAALGDALRRGILPPGAERGPDRLVLLQCPTELHWVARGPEPLRLPLPGTRLVP